MARAVLGGSFGGLCRDIDKNRVADVFGICFNARVHKYAVPVDDCARGWQMPTGTAARH